MTMRRMKKNINKADVREERGKKCGYRRTVNDIVMNIEQLRKTE